MDGPRLIVLIFLLLMLLGSPDTQTPSPSQRRELDFQVTQERYALTTLSTSSYGDFDAAEHKWINVTGLRKEDGYAWELLPRVQERASQQASTLIGAWHRSIGIKPIRNSNATLTEDSVLSHPPFYHNVTGITHGYWTRSEIGKGSVAPVLNLTALVPNRAYSTDHYTRNITSSAGELHLRLDEKGSRFVELEDASAREITAEMTVEDDSSSGNGWQMTLHGIHHPRDGSIILATTGPRFAGVFALPFFALSQRSFTAAQHLLNDTLNAAVKTQDSASATNALSPWSSSPQSPSDFPMPTPHCEYIVYLQQHPIEIGASDPDSIESELRHPTGRWNMAAPPITMSAILFSPDCGFVIESKGPPDFAPQYGHHMQGLKLETYIRLTRRLILASALIICAEISLLLRQMREASTPSTRSRVSFYAVGMMAMGDGFVTIFLLLVSMAYDALSLELVATAFLAFFCVGFLGMRFLIDIWTVQGPEREERQRQQERHNAATNSTPLPSMPGLAAIMTTAGADTLPLPVTAARPASINIPATAPEDQARLVGNQSPTTATTMPPLPEAAQGNTAAREASRLYTRFCLTLGGLLFLTLYSWTWPRFLRTCYIRLLSVVYLSFYTPQIYRNIMRNCRKALQWQFVVGQAFLRVCPFAYYYLFEDHVSFSRTDSNWLIALLGWLWFQICILVSQELFGPRFFIPQACSRWIPTAYDYHPVLREEDEESGALMPIGFTQTSLPADDLSLPSTTSERKKEEESRNGKKFFDCAICMQRFEVPVVPRNADGGSVSTTTAGIGVGVKDLVFGRRAYMVTPCRHIFHSVCLEGWMRYRLQCPICRDNLPPL